MNARRLFASRDVRVLLAGETLSMFGDRAMFLVLGIWVKSLTGSNAAAGFTFFLFVLPSLAAPFAGFLVDRLPRRPLMIATDCFAAAAVLLLLLVHGREELWLIYLVTVLYGASSTVFGSAQSALLTVMVPGELLPDANAAFQTVREGLRLVAPLVGAGLYATAGPGSAAVIDAATFGVSALCLASLRVKEEKPPPREHRMLVELAAGAGHIVRTTPLRQIVLVTGLALLVVGFAETIIFAVVDQGLDRPPSFLGIFLSTQGVGAIAGGLTAAPVLRRLGDGRVVGAGILLFAVGDGAFAVPSVAVVLVGIAVAGLGISWAVVGFATAIQVRSPAQLQGRVYSAAEMILGTPQTASIALGAALSTVIDFRALVGVMTLITAACGLYLVRLPLSPAVRPDAAAPALTSSPD